MVESVTKFYMVTVKRMTYSIYLYRRMFSRQSIMSVVDLYLSNDCWAGLRPTMCRLTIVHWLMTLYVYIWNFVSIIFCS